MSQHHFHILHNEKETHVLMGWDRPLQGFFMVIEKEHDPEDEPYFSNLNWKNSHPKELDSFIEFLDKVKLDLPKEMILEIEEDQRIDAGNKTVTHEILDGIYNRIQH